MMHHRGQHARKKNSGPPPRLPTFADHTVGQHKTLPDADGWSTVDTKETKKVQRLRKWANKFIPQPPPLPRRADYLDRPHFRQDRHAFNPPLSYAYTNARDPYVIAANKHLKALNNRTLQTFAASLRISTLERPAWHDYAFGRKIRQFSVGRVGLVVKVPLYMSTPNDELMVINGAKSIKFEDWLSTLPEAESVDLLGPAAYQTMYEWHRSLGAQKKCPRLNKDVMDIVLLHTIGEVRHVERQEPREGDGQPSGYNISRRYDVRDVILCMEHSDSCMGTPLGSPAIQPVDHRVMYLNKELAETARHLLRFHTIKSFSTTYILEHCNLPLQPLFLDSLTRIQLAFDDDQYFEFFKVDLPGCNVGSVNLDKPQPSAVLRTIPNLNYLELWFHSPIRESQRYTHLWPPESARRLYLYYFRQPFPCRRAVVDYIMCFAYSSIFFVKSVNITGYVKTETRDHWLNILRDRRHPEDHMKAVEQRIKDIQKKPVTDFPPKCECRVPCYSKIYDSATGWATDRMTRMTRAEVKALSQALKDYKFDFDDDLDTNGLIEWGDQYRSHILRK